MKKAWVWVLLAVVLFVTWAVIVAPHTLPVFLQSAS